MTDGKISESLGQEKGSSLSGHFQNGAVFDIFWWKSLVSQKKELKEQTKLIRWGEEKPLAIGTTNTLVADISRSDSLSRVFAATTYKIRRAWTEAKRQFWAFSGKS